MSLTAQQWSLCIGQKATAEFHSWFLSTMKPYTGIITGVYTDEMQVLHIVLDYKIHGGSLNTKPILRTLDQITEDEKKEFAKKFILIPASNLNLEKDHMTFESFGMMNHCGFYYLDQYDWMAAKGFDIRGWIKQGLAIKQEEQDAV